MSNWNLIEKEHNLAIQHSIMKQRWLDHAKQAEKEGNLRERAEYLAKAEEEERLRLLHLENVKKLGGGGVDVQRPGTPTGVELKLKAMGFTFPGF